MSIYYNMYSIEVLIVDQFTVIFPYWIVGVIFGSAISVFGSTKIIDFASRVKKNKFILRGIIIAALLGAASPVCMYGTIPLITSLAKKGIPQYLLAAFMVSSILINPNLFIFSFALGIPIAMVRLLACLVAGIIAGIMVHIFFKNKLFFNFEGFEKKTKSECKSPTIRVFLADIHRGIVKTAPYFLIGILLTALFDRFIPKYAFISLFGANEKLGVIMAASLGLPVYVCGGGTIPILKAWLGMGMSAGAAIAFMISGAATKITNLSAVKIILGSRNFIIYILFNTLFALLAGWFIDAVNIFLKG